MRFQVVSTVCSRIVRAHSGQSTVEFAIVLAAFICVAIGFAALWDVLHEGLLVEHALQTASHHLSGVARGAWADVLAY